MRSLYGRMKWMSVAVVMAMLIASGMLIERVLSDGSDQPVAARLINPAMAQDMGQQTIPDVVEKVVPAVVYIQSKARIKQGQVNSPLMEDPFFRRFFEDFFRHHNVPKEREQQYLGSGVIISDKGFILTNNHLVANAEEVEVLLPDKRTFDATVVGTDPRSDVAVLKIEGEDLPSVKLGRSEDLRLGETVLAIGYPYAVGQTVTRGIVSALGRSLDLVDYENFIQTDAAINPGNSGGALINTNGELVGINTAIYSRSGGNQGIGFAIPIELARKIMDSLIEHGRVIRGYVGVVPQDINPEMAEFFKLKDTKGVLISHVAEDSPAERAGFERGDVVISFDGKRVSTREEFRRFAAEAQPDSEVKIKVIRNGKEKTLSVRMGENPGDQAATAEELEDRNPVFLGVGLETLSDEYRESLNIPSRIKGVIVTQVDRNTPAEKAGLARGDVIVEINRQKIRDLGDFKEIIGNSESSKVLLLVYRGGNYFYTAIKE